MEQFNYKEWKKNPQRKVVMRSGEEVTVKGYKTGYDYPVEVELINGNYNYYTKDGVFIDGARDERDLFFADDVGDKAQPKTINGIYWRKAKAGHNFGKDTVVLYNGDPDVRLVRCAVYDCIYIHIEDLLKLPKE